MPMHSDRGACLPVVVLYIAGHRRPNKRAVKRSYERSFKREPSLLPQNNERGIINRWLRARSVVIASVLCRRQCRLSPRANDARREK